MKGKDAERTKRHCSFVLGHTANNCMTVIDAMVRYPRLFGMMISRRVLCRLVVLCAGAHKEISRLRDMRPARRAGEEAPPCSIRQGRTKKSVACATCAPRGEQGRPSLLDCFLVRWR